MDERARMGTARGGGGGSGWARSCGGDSGPERSARESTTSLERPPCSPAGTRCRKGKHGTDEANGEAATARPDSSPERSGMTHDTDTDRKAEWQESHGRARCLHRPTWPPTACYPEELRPCPFR